MPLQDLWNLGRLIGLEEFGSDHNDYWAATERRLRLASASDRRGQTKDSKNVVLSTLKGKSGPGTTARSAYEKEMVITIKDIRERFSGAVIRRTVRSVDNTGNTISGLEPFHEHVLILKLYQHEMENLELLAKDLVDGDAHKVAKFAAGHVRTVRNKLLIMTNLQHRTSILPLEGRFFIRAATLARLGIARKLWKSGTQIPRESWTLLCISLIGTSQRITSLPSELMTTSSSQTTRGPR